MVAAPGYDDLHAPPSPAPTMVRIGKWTLSDRVVDHSIQALLIFASVFLAFWLNDYRIQVGEQRATEAVVEAVVSEVSANKAILERWAPYHRGISEALEARLRDGTDGDLGPSEPFRPQAYLDERGIFQEILTYDSWEYLRQSDLRLDIHRRLAVNRIFRQQQYVDEAVREVVDFLNSRELFDPGLALQNHVMFYRLMTELYHQETALLENYRRFLEEFEEGGRAPGHG
jgi:hypothetical protein